MTPDANTGPEPDGWMEMRDAMLAGHQKQMAALGQPVLTERERAVWQMGWMAALQMVEHVEAVEEILGDAAYAEAGEDQ